MKKLLILTVGSVLALASCSNLDMDADIAANTKENAEDIFGMIDPRQSWNCITSGSVTITADAPLEDIVKVQILSESPFGNENATVLNEVSAQKGAIVTMSYDAPNHCKDLVAACVSSNGTYYIRLFDIGETKINFDFNGNHARTRAADDSSVYPDPSSIVLNSPKESFNALRTDASLASEYKNVLANDNVNGKGKNRYYDLWADGTWANDRLWSVNSVSGGSWNIENGTIYRNITETFSEAEKKTLQNFCNTYLQKTGGNKTPSGKKNNWETIIKSSSFNTYNNYLTSNGSPLTVVPVQMNTTEGAYNSVYYYYYNPKDVSGMSSEEEVNYIKSLPKYKAYNGFKGGSSFFRNKEYLLPYYGDGVPSAGSTAVSCIIPKGYKIGFLNSKDYENKGDYTHCASGCTYGDGRLNFEVNHLMGHYFSAINKNISQEITAITPDGKKDIRYGLTEDGMDWTSPRIAIFTANNKTYLCFEDGADCNFCDMILEIKEGVEYVVDLQEVPTATYTMCFEDRPHTADYDMNDVVLRCNRKSKTELQLSLIAAGANDNLFIYGTGIAAFDEHEIHDIFQAKTADANGNRFINTEKDGETRDIISYDVTVSEGMTIPQYLRGIYIINKSNGNYEISYPKNLGEPPYAIIIPALFQYPLERTRINQAYIDFTTWARNLNVSDDWYLRYEGQKIFPTIFK